MNQCRLRIARLLATAGVAMGLCMLAWGSIKAVAQGESVGFGRPEPRQINVGDPVTWVEIVLTGTDIYGYQLEVAYDPFVLEAVSGEFVNDFVKAQSIPGAWNGTIDPLAGTVRFAATQLFPTLPVTGSGVVARVAFRGIWSAALPLYTPVTVQNARIANSEGQGENLSPATQNYLVVVQVVTSIGLSGECGDGWDGSGCIRATAILTGQNLYGYQFVVTFLPADLTVTSAGFSNGFIHAGWTPPGWSATFDNVAGTVRFAATQTNPDLPKTGFGEVAWICFAQPDDLVEVRVTTVGVEGVKASTIDGDPMYGEGIGQSVTLTPIATIQGRVELQGRTNWSLVEASTVPASTTDISDSSGWYTLRVCSGIEHKVVLKMGRYLDTWRTLTPGVGTITLPTVRLLGGDLDNDDLVDVSDLTILGGKYYTAVNPLTERADINADGWVDLGDLTILGGNYWRTSPVPWP